MRSGRKGDTGLTEKRNKLRRDTHGKWGQIKKEYKTYTRRKYIWKKTHKVGTYREWENTQRVRIKIESKNTHREWEHTRGVKIHTERDIWGRDTEKSIIGK